MHDVPGKSIYCNLILVNLEMAFCIIVSYQ